MNRALSTGARRLIALPLAFALALALLAGDRTESRAQTAAQCSDPNQAPEEFGPTDISAVGGNRGLSAGFNERGTLTVLKWPSPSYYDQIKYRTTDRGRKRMGALPNEGAFVGVALKRKGDEKWRFSWLRELPARGKQHFADDDTDEVITSFRDPDDHLTIRQSDLVSDEADVLYRSIRIHKGRRSKVVRARVIAFANFNPVVSKDAQAPYDDWCSEEDNDNGGSYDKDLDVVMHDRQGTDASTGDPSRVTLGMGFIRASNGHEVGTDTYQGAEGRSAYDDAADGKLAGDDAAPGQADAAIADDLNLRRRDSASTTILMAAASTPKELRSTLRSARSSSYKEASRSKKRWWTSWLRGSKLPKDAPRPVTELAKRALITLRQNADKRGAIVRSIATQPPFGLDWIRDGAYINRALDVAGYPQLVATHNRRYAQLQATFTSTPPGGGAIPSGNWGQNYYADGVVGGTIPYEIDETGLGIWTLWDHYARTGDRVYLLSAQIYESIQRSAQYLSDVCRDPTNGLHCVANEEDDPSPGQTLVGAQAVWLGLDAASRAARVRNTEDSLVNATKWEQRRDEIGAAIEATFFDEDCDCYTQDYQTGGTFLWPVGFVGYASSTAAAQADVNFDHIDKAIRGRDEIGAYESRALLGNAYVWTTGRDRRKIREALEWVAAHTATGPGLLGSSWSTFPADSSRIVARAGQADAFNQAMFYLAAIKSFGKEAWSN